MSTLYHVTVLCLLSIWGFSFKRTGMTILLFTIPLLGEIVQVFIPSRTPDFMDILHGYLGILAGYCLVKMWREIKPAVKNVQYHMEK
jgi:glycopeptide antibiotics resistance protein